VNPPDIVVATCAYGTEFVWRHGQNECIPIVAGAGARGIEESDGGWLQILKLLPSEAPRGIEFPIPPEEFEKRTREYVTHLKRA
jgi:hypothetical protein